MARKNASPIVVLHDVESVRTEIAAALRTADPQHRAGLEEALRLVDRYAEVTDEERTREWVRRVVEDAGVDLDSHHVRAVKALREAVPGLGLVDANNLVNSAR
ncbi:hypothetical protein [Streptomyces sp. PU-14G]|uniref:hypothetical protein n=1 Tax=Streptomyces sp. PU-14G TaxID=2800808 RepID=UPI0034DE30F2